MAAQLNMPSLGDLVSQAERIKAQKALNQENADTQPFRQRALVQGEQDAGMKRSAAAARAALSVMGDLSTAAPEEAQARFMAARQVVADLGVDVSKIPEQYSPELLKGIQALADTYDSGDKGSMVQSTWTDANGNQVIQYRDGRTTMGGKAYIAPVYDKDTGTYFDPITRQVLRPSSGAPQQPPAAPQATPPGQPPAQPTQIPVPMGQPQSGNAFDQAQQEKMRREAQAAAMKAAAETAARETAQTQTERAMSRPQAEQSLERALRYNDNVVAEIDRALALADSATATGLAGMVSGAIPGTPAANLQATIDQINSNQFLDEMKALKAAGGSLGSATEREGDKLQSAAANLSRMQGTPQFKQQLLKLRQNYIESKQAISSAFDGMYGGQGAPRTTVPPTNSRGWKLHTDAKGNRAYVSPDGLQYEEVR